MAHTAPVLLRSLFSSVTLSKPHTPSFLALSAPPWHSPLCQHVGLGIKIDLLTFSLGLIFQPDYGWFLQQDFFFPLVFSFCPPSDGQQWGGAVRGAPSWLAPVGGHNGALLGSGMLMSLPAQPRDTGDSLCPSRLDFCTLEAQPKLVSLSTAATSPLHSRICLIGRGGSILHPQQYKASSVRLWVPARCWWRSSGRESVGMQAGANEQIPL